MSRRSNRIVGLLAGLAVVAATAAATPATAATQSASSANFVVRSGDDFRLAGKDFRFNGSNNYYLMYRSPVMVDDVFGDAKTAGFNVMRTWGFLDIGNQDDTNSVHHKESGVYFQYWDGTRPAYNDGADGLVHLDKVLQSAAQAGIKLVIPLTNNWSAFGGMDQYVRWRGGQYHDDFYTDPVIRGWYKDWINHLLNRTNTLTGIKYKDDPTVMAWELANEPRCVGSGVYPRSADGCGSQTIVNWAADISGQIKAIDSKQLVGTGDEGFLCTDPRSADAAYNCRDGVDSLALAKLSTIDFMSFHLYPDSWGTDAAWGVDWIKRHGALAKAIGKPVMLGEFGWLDKSTRNPVYQSWTNTAIAAGVDGLLYWILSGVQDDGSLYPDYDGFTVYCPSPVCTTLSNAGEELRAGQKSRNPVADDDAAQTLRDESVTLNPTANDIAYRTKINPSTLDLDPTTSGRQRTITVTGGTFAGTDAAVTFTPSAGFTGKVSTIYTVRDEAGRTSNPAMLRVTVKPRPGDALVLSGFETGTEGWAPASWQSNAGTVSSTVDFHPVGTQGLQVSAADGGWFGLATLPEPIDLSGKSFLRYELRTAGVGTSTSIAVQTGPGYTWCQSSWGYVNAATTTTVEADLLDSMSCDATALADVRAVFAWFSGGGEFDIDQLRAE